MEKLEESKYATMKSGIFTGGLHIKSRKSYYAILKDRVLEIYKSSKEEKLGKEAKFLFDLSLTFNIHLHYDAVLKDCIALMMPDETFLMRFEMDSNVWFEMLLDKTRQARSAKLGRLVFRNEYFEVAWDVEPIKKPKLSRRIKDKEPVEDLVIKNERFFLGKKRLCMYPHTLYIIRKGITASKDTSPPFCSDDYIAFPVSAISIYGHHNRYFFFRAGRCAPTGAGELWFYTDNSEAASSINDKIIKICERENEKKKTRDRMHFSRSNISTRSSRNQTHRERSHTHTQRSSIEAARSLGKEMRQIGTKYSVSTINGEEKQLLQLTGDCGRFIEETAQNPSDLLDGYTQMDCVQDCNGLSTHALNSNYMLAEVRSYMFNNSNCFECMKLSGRKNNEISGSRFLPCGNSSENLSDLFVVHSDAFDNAASKNVDDLRKRVQSLGSKSWMRAVRKIPDPCNEHSNDKKVRQGTSNSSNAVGRSGTNLIASMDDSNHSHASSFDVDSSVMLYSGNEDVQKVRNEDFENLFGKIQLVSNLEQRNNSELSPTNNSDYILPSFDSSLIKNSVKTADNASNSCWVGTILEQNASSGTSRSQSPVSFKEKNSDGSNEIKISSETMNHFSVPKIPIEISREHERFVSDETFVEDKQKDLQYVTLHWHRSNVSSPSSRNSLRATGGPVDINCLKKRCEYAVIQPHNS
uniref:IRS-type PTB domain-containing protein n=1 Tax=Onchocerca volvulus TaxID=6282 RepID=A0A8R1TRG0_ONCVO